MELKLFDQEVEIPGKKRIKNLEPDPEEQIIDTSTKPNSGFVNQTTLYDKEEIIDTCSKPKHGSMREDYTDMKIRDLEDFVDTWDIEDSEEQNYPFTFKHNRNQSVDQFFEQKINEFLEEPSHEALPLENVSIRNDASVFQIRN